MKDRNARLSAYLLPNLITTGNLFWGFFSIVKALQGQFIWAVYAIFLAAIFDVLDGRVARMTGGTSEFGVQYDSLCDLVSFGLGPAFLVFQYSLRDIGRFGWICCFIFLACGALRLARFNVRSGRGNSSGDFVGLPIPMAALAVSSFIFFIEDLKSNNSAMNLGQFRDIALDPMFVQIGLIFLTLLTAGAMVSNIRYFSHKSLKLGSLKPFKLLTLVVLLIGIVAYQPEIFAVLLVVGYALSGPLDYLLGRKAVQNDEDDIFHEMETEEAEEQPSDNPPVSIFPNRNRDLNKK